MAAISGSITLAQGEAYTHASRMPQNTTKITQMPDLMIVTVNVKCTDGNVGSSASANEQPNHVFS